MSQWIRYFWIFFFSTVYETVFSVGSFLQDSSPVDARKSRYNAIFDIDIYVLIFGTIYQHRYSTSANTSHISLSRTVVKERLRWLAHALQTEDDRLPKTVPFRHPFQVKEELGHP